MLTPAETRALLDRIEPGSLVGLRDRALLSVLVYSFAPVSAAVGMRRQDYFRQGLREWLRLHEKGGKRHDVPAHHRAEEAVAAYVKAAGLDDPKAPLFQSVDRAGRLTGRPLGRRAVLAMIMRRAAAAALPPSTELGNVGSREPKLLRTDEDRPIVENVRESGRARVGPERHGDVEITRRPLDQQVDQCDGAARQPVDLVEHQQARRSVLLDRPRQHPHLLHGG